MDSNRVIMFVRKGKAYIPTLAKTDKGVYVTINPVFTVELNIAELMRVTEDILKIGHPEMKHPTKDQLAKMGHPMLKAADVSSWKKLSEGGTAYWIIWRKEEIVLEFSKKGERGSFAVDSSKTQHFPNGTDLRMILQVMLDDLKSHPEYTMAE